MNLIIMGPQGSGKGTQAKLLADKYKMPQLSIGQLYRENIQKKSHLKASILTFLLYDVLISDQQHIIVWMSRAVISIYRPLKVPFLYNNIIDGKNTKQDKQSKIKLIIYIWLIIYFGEYRGI